MKFNNCLLLICASLLNNATYAEYDMGWAKTPFWEGPISKELDAELVPVFPKNLKEQCRDFKKRLSDEGNYLTYLEFDRWRKYNPEVGSNLNFVAYFKIANDKISNTFPVIQTEGTLPFYFQEKTEQVFNLAAVDLQNGSLKISADSLSDFGNKLGSVEASISSYSLTSYRAQQVIQVDGKDLACDLLEKKAGFTVSANTIINLPVEEKNKIQDFYLNKISPEVNNVLSSGSSSALKAALIGFKLGKAIESLQTKNDERSQEVVLKKLFTTLFNEKLERTSHWIPDSYQNPTKYLIDAAQGVDGYRVKINLNGRL